MRDVVVLSGVRTAIGDYGGALKQVAPADLAAKVVREAVLRAKIDPNEVGHLVFGNVIHGESRDMYLARVACINGGLAQHASALTVNRLCGSGLQAIISASQNILLNDTDVAVAGGAESMSRGGYLLPALRWGQRSSRVRYFSSAFAACLSRFLSNRARVRCRCCSRGLLNCRSKASQSSKSS